jgi:GNAT superfamily N-acetyltransferase
MPDSGLHISLESELGPGDREAVVTGLREYNRRPALEPGHVSLALFLRDARGTVRGGLLGETGHRWLHVEIMWVSDELRGQGWGARLLEAAEQEGCRRGCRGVYLNTFEFQAPGFYQRYGYTVFGVLED